MKKTLASRDLVRSETLGSDNDRTPEGPLAKPAPLPERPVHEGADQAAMRPIVETREALEEDARRADQGGDARQLGRVRPRSCRAGATIRTTTRRPTDTATSRTSSGWTSPPCVQKAALGMSANELGERTEKARDLVRGEVWELIDYVQAPPK